MRLQECSRTKNIFLFLLMMMAVYTSVAQEKEPSEKKEEEGPYHKITLVLGHAHVPESIDDNGKKQMSIFPSWGLDYDFFFNE